MRPPTFRGGNMISTVLIRYASYKEDRQFKIHESK